MNKITKNYEISKKVQFKIAGVGSESKWHVVVLGPFQIWICHDLPDEEISISTERCAG
jgi:hypothetical protein